MVYLRVARRTERGGNTNMRTTRPIASHPISTQESGPFRSFFAEAIRYWEPRRLIYNLVLTAVCAAWTVVTWPHFRPALTLTSLLLLSLLALIANICYSSAYLMEILFQRSSPSAVRRRLRWALWLVGTLFAIVLANYWIADEIYPFVR
jgi:hypothetical protein